MKKLFIGLLLIIAIVGVVAYTQMNALVKTGVETAGPQALSVPVTVGGVSISPLSGRVQVTDFAVGQPDGFGEGSLMSLGALDLKVDTNTLLDDHIIVDEIIIDRPMFDARVIGSQSNFQALQQRLAANAGPSEIDGQPITLTIRRLAVRDPQISVQKEGGILQVDEDVNLADFTLTDLGTDEEGLAPREIARHIMDTLQPQITRALVAAGAGDTLKGLAKDARGELEKQAGSLLNKLRSKRKSEDDGNN